MARVLDLLRKSPIGARPDAPEPAVVPSARRPSLTGPVRDGLERPRVRTEGWAPKGAEQKDITCAVRKGLDKFALI